MGTNDEISDTTPLWWELQNIPTEVVRELRRRSNTNNIGMSIPTPFTNATFDFEKNYNKYKGPMTPWVRVFSNSTGKTINGMVPKSAYLNKNDKEKDYNGFLLKGGEGFFDAFGYEQGKPLNTKAAIIGYEADGTPHYIDNKYRSQTMIQAPLNADFPQNSQSSPIIPPPGLISVSVKQSKEHLTYASFKFKCYGIAQLEYLTPFFLTAGINVFIEFGWNLFNQQSLLDLNSLDECLKLVTHPQTALDRANKSNGNYGCISGLITKYSFTTTDGFVYDCNVDLTSRQALYAGMKTDNSAKITTASDKSDNTDKPDIEYVDLKTFVKSYLPSINVVMRNKVNFMHYIIKKINADTEKNKQKKEADIQANIEQSKIGNMYNNIGGLPGIASLTSNVGPPSVPIPVAAAVTGPNAKLLTSDFYKGKPEDRVFAGRSDDFYRKKDSPDGVSDVIQYGTVTPNLSSYTQISYLDKDVDFDGKTGATEVWMQLDFVFELVNLFMSNLTTNQFKIDISDVIISAHPNLISCDKHVLIPNPVSPKINKGTIYKEGSVNSGFLKGENRSGVSVSDDGTSTGNAFLSQLQDITVTINTDLEKRYKNAVENNTMRKFYNNMTIDESFYFAAVAAKKTFKTSGRLRDNIDSVINYLYYNSENNNIDGSAAFPFAKANGSYKQYYYGYLKHLYISKTKLIDIVKSDDIKNYKQFINAILTTINESVDNFWKFDIVEGKDKDKKSILSIIDKNTSNFDVLKQVYMFELGKTTNVVKGINFDVSLTNDQAVQVQFGGQNSDNLKEKIQNQTASNPTAALKDLTAIPFLKFVDRMDKYQLQLLISGSIGDGVKTLVPGTTSGITNDNSAIEDLQTYGSKEKNNILCITTKQVSSNYRSAIEPTKPTTVLKLSDPLAQLGAQIQLQSLNQSSRVNSVPSIGSADRKQSEKEKLTTIQDDTRTPKNYKFLCLSSEMKSKLTQMLNDDDYKNNVTKYSGVADNFNITIKFDGIFSFRNLQVFAISNLPNPYVPGNVIFQILEVDHEISSGKWETTVTALVRCIGGTKLEYIPV